MNTQESQLFTSDLMESTYLWCYRKLGNTHDAEDLSQEILLSAILSYRKKAQAGTAPAAFYPWYWGLAQNRLMLFFRNRKKQAVLLGETIGSLRDSEPYYFDLADIDEAIIAEEERRALTYQISLLSRIQRECVVMYYLQKKSVKEIAAILDIPEGTVKTRLFDARKNVRKGMENNMENTNTESKNKRLSYAPAVLDKCGSNGIPEHWGFLSDRIVEQIIAVCACEGKTPREIAEAIGVAPVYFEDKLEYLLKHKFIKETAPNTYIDDFCVFPQQAWLDYCVDQNRVLIGKMPRVAETVKSLLPEARKHILNEKDFSDGYLLWFLYVRAVSAMDETMLKHYKATCSHNVPEGNGKNWRLVVRVRYPDEEMTMKGDYYGVSWSNMHWHFKTSRRGFTVANLYEAEPFNDRDHIITESNADLFMRIYEDPHLPLIGNEQEQAAFLVSKGFLVSRDGGLYLNVPVLNDPAVDKIDALFADALHEISREMVADLVKTADENLLPHVRPDLMEEYVNYVMLLTFDCISELFYYAMNEGHDLEIPKDYSTSAAGIAVYLK